MTYEEKQFRVSLQEDIDRYITTAVISDILNSKGFTFSATPTDLKCAVDLNCTIYDSHKNPMQEFDVEIKTRNKSNYDLSTYGYNIELKESKLARILEYCGSKTVLYVSLFTNTTTQEQTAYIFNLTAINWDRIEKFNWRIKAIQMLPGSDYQLEPTYKIPMEKALRAVPLKPYYDNLPPELIAKQNYLKS